MMKATNDYSDFDYPVLPTLFFEFHGSEAGVAEQAELVRDISSEFGGGDFQWATKTEDRNRLWQARHDAYFASIAMRPGCKLLSTDVCVPISQLTDVLTATRQDVDDLNLIGAIVGHVGDGNFHVGLCINPDDEEEMVRVNQMNSQLGPRRRRHPYRRTVSPRKINTYAGN